MGSERSTRDGQGNLDNETRKQSQAPNNSDDRDDRDRVALKERLTKETDLLREKARRVWELQIEMEQAVRAYKEALSELNEMDKHLREERVTAGENTAHAAYGRIAHRVPDVPNNRSTGTSD